MGEEKRGSKDRRRASRGEKKWGRKREEAKIGEERQGDRERVLSIGLIEVKPQREKQRMSIFVNFWLLPLSPRGNDEV